MTSVLEQLAPELAALKVANNAGWNHIEAAILKTDALRSQIFSALSRKPSLVNSPETSVVLFGSMARNEFTSASDVDWTLLIDGPADPEHRNVAHEIAGRIDNEGLKGPGSARVFGSIAFSHGIVHQIGGEEDSNRNTTQRILLLLESFPIGEPSAHDRVLDAIITRYFADDMVYSTGKTKERRVPRFLLNDIIRYWRTVAVDYASKKWERNNQGWALRNIKLRMSRKLTFCAGLLACFNCELDDSIILDQDLFGLDTFILPLVKRMRDFNRHSPLEVLIRAMRSYNVPSECINRALSSYDSFLGIIADEEKRCHLDALPIQESGTDTVFNAAREISYEFQGALDGLFFDNPHIQPLTRKYGVF